jgi:hypothetical protein
MESVRPAAVGSFLSFLALALVALTGCGSGTDITTTTPTTATPGTPTPATPDVAQSAIWPSAGVVFDAPEAVAEDFVAQVFDVPVTLGPFRQGDSRSGEIDVIFTGEGDTDASIVRSTLLVRQLGPADGWFVLAAVNDNATITAPEAGAEVVPGPVTVEGRARGFEANVVVEAYVVGDASAQLDQQITLGGALEDPEPYTVTLDLAGADAGRVIMLLVRGGTGLATDPGEFSAIPVVISSPVPLAITG